MFNGITNALSLSKLLYGLSKSIDIIKKITPIYNDISPLIKNIPAFKEKISTYLYTSNHSKNPIKNIERDVKAIKVNNNYNIKGPTFFQ